MARYAFILPREEMVEPARKTAARLGMDVVLNCSAATEDIPDIVEKSGRLGADIIVARGRQASIIRQLTKTTVVELQLTGQEIAVLLRRARDLAPRVERPKIGVVTIPNMIGDISRFDDVLDIELHTYFTSGNEEMEQAVELAAADGMDVILGGDFVNACCRRLGRRTLFFDGTEESIYVGLCHACDAGRAIDAEQKNTAHLQTLLNYSFNGIIEMNLNGVIIQANDMSCKILNKRREELLGTCMTALIAAEDIEAWNLLLLEKRELYFSLLNAAGVNIVANAAIVIAGEAAERIVFSFYEMRQIERSGASALQEHYRLHQYLARGRFEDVSRTSREMKRTVKLARTFADTMQPILIQGEVGSGKSLFAQSIHNASPCAKGPFVVFDCGAYAQGQAEALSNAIKEADGGTICIDGAELLDQTSQYVLRRLLESAVVRVESNEHPLKVQVRVIASISGELSDYMRRGCFQPKLYYMMLAPMNLRLPPLRTRREDLEKTISLCLDDCASRLGRYVVLTDAAHRLLMEYPWPGNYVQLRAFIERMVLTAPGRTVGDGYVSALLNLSFPDEPDDGGDEPRKGALGEAQLLTAALARNGGSRTAAAAELGISKTTLWRRMKRCGIYDRHPMI